MDATCCKLFVLLVLSSVCQAFLLQTPSKHVKIFETRAERGIPDNRLLSGTEGMTRVSFRECNLTAGERLDCGFYGVSEYECYGRGCCWGETKEEDVPWCYHSKPTMNKYCTVNPDERDACGAYGIRKSRCLSQGCCWRPSSRASAPWCFHHHVPTLTTDQCGVPTLSPQIMSRIVGGDEAKPHTWPWQISLQISRDADTEPFHICGGSLIAPQWVVSAKHCYVSPRQYSVSIVAGMHSLASTSEPKERVVITESFLHNDSDVMLMKLKEPVSFTEIMSPVCLPSLGESFSAGKHCYTTGWGTLASGGSQPDKLQQVMVPLMDTDVCNQEDWYNGTVDDTMVCAGYEEGGKDSCQGDSGGPLVCFQNDRWVIIGVTSWGHGCAFEKKPGVYASLIDSLCWLRTTMEDNP